jgi:BirA family biotin operon repressor/biotin-[acetyl-CoA-carboxylase] ligase
MVLNEKLLRLMADGRFVSGEALARELGVSRAAVWQHLKAWQSHGLRVDAVRGRGYRLAAPFSPLDARLVAERLTHPEDVQLEVLHTVDSTNSHCLSRLAHGRALQVTAAEMQLEGRGRMGRRWLSLPGYSLVFSMGRCEQGRPADLAGLSLVAGLAVVECLRSLGMTQAGLKWPNDVVTRTEAGWQKLGGILVELQGAFADTIRWVVGIGLNLGPSCPPAPDSAYDIGQLSRWWPDVARHRNVLLAALIDSWLDCEALWKREGLASMCERWMGMDVLRGESVSVQTSAGWVAGVARGIDEQGWFLLETADGIQRFSGGEISIRPVDHSEDAS